MECPECGATMILRHRRSDGAPFYGCSAFPGCRCTHGAHADGRPLGRPGNKATKMARIRAHEVFDKIWQTGHMRRNEAYKWLRATMQLPDGEAHIGMMDEATCDKLIAACRLQFPLICGEE